VSGWARRDPVDIAGPRPLAGVVGRPLNFTVRGQLAMRTTLVLLITAATVLTACGSKSESLGQDLRPGEIASVGNDSYEIRLTSKPMEAWDKEAMKRASEYCARTGQTVVVKNKTLDLGYGYTLTWSCVRLTSNNRWRGP